MMNKEEIIKELDKQNRELGEELSLTKDRLDKTLFEKDHYKHLYSEVKKQKDDVIEVGKKINDYINNHIDCVEGLGGVTSFLRLSEKQLNELDDLLRMLGEIDNE